MFKIMLIHQSHKLQIILALSQGLVIKTAPAYTYQVALAADAQWLFTVNHTTPLS
jgi:flagellar motor switch protein FliM